MKQDKVTATIEAKACACTVKQQSPGAYERIVAEKRELDVKIVKLNAFLFEQQKAHDIVEYFQLEQMRRQLDVMTDYSNILNTRILRWNK